MDLDGYIILIRKLSPDPLGDRLFQSLAFIAHKGIASAYEIEQNLKGTSDYAAYKNIRDSCRRLNRLQLVEIAKKKRNSFGKETIFYRITELGWLKLVMTISHVSLKLILHDKNSQFYKSGIFYHYLYGLVEKKTIQALESDVYIYSLWRYLVNTTRDLSEYIKTASDSDINEASKTVDYLFRSGVLNITIEGEAEWIRQILTSASLFLPLYSKTGVSRYLNKYVKDSVERRKCLEFWNDTQLLKSDPLLTKKMKSSHSSYLFYHNRFVNAPSYPLLSS